MKFVYGSLLIVACLFFTSLAAPVAHADEVIYTFSGINSTPLGDGLSVAMQFTAPGFITSLTEVYASQLTSCTNCLVSTTIPAAEMRPDDPGGPAIGFLDTNQTEYFYRFPAGAFTTLGTYSTTSQSAFTGTLTVSETPEPGTCTLFGTALAGLFGIGRRRLFPSA